MTVRIGSIELNGVQNIHTEESRALVEQRVPAQQGSVFQDLGRDPVSVVLDGLLFSAEALKSLETLRTAQIKAQPLSFAADIAIGTELTDVLIEEITIRQVAGYAHRYRYTMRVREYKQPPQPADAAVTPVNAAVEADAKTWSNDNLAAVQVLQNPNDLPQALANNPNILNHLSAEDLAGSLAQNKDSIAAGKFSQIFDAVKQIDPAKAMEFVSAMRDAGSLSDFIQKYADAGLSFASNLTGLDLKKYSKLIKALGGSVEFIKKLKTVGDNASKLVNDIQTLEDPFTGLKPLLDTKK
ncbi:MAG: hypothetical protein WAX77_03855 [Methylococcaceae bacterium]